VICGPGGVTLQLPAPPNNQQQASQMVLQQLPAQQLFTIVNAASRMPFNACKALAANTALNAAMYAVSTTIHMIQACHREISASLDMYLRSKLSGEPGTHTVLTQYLYKTGIDLSFAS